MIDDPELRSLFRAESEEHLQALESGLLHLESQPEDTTILEHLFRSAHSLKGAARMLGVERLETLAHHFEDELGAARRGRRAMSSAGADRLYHGLDAMRRLAQEACDGEDAQVDIPAVLARLRGELPPAPSVCDTSLKEDLAETAVFGVIKSVGEDSEAEPESHALEEPKRDVRSVDPAPLREADVVDPRAVQNDSFASHEIAVPTTSTFKIETIRVEPQRLDALMTLAGEMAVTTARAVRALGVIGELVELWKKGIAAGTQGMPFRHSIIAIQSERSV